MYSLRARVGKWFGVTANFAVEQVTPRARGLARKAAAGGDHGNQHTGGKVPDVEKFSPSGKLEPTGKTRDIAAKQLNAGWSGKTA